jgi:hypothetical protein
MTQTKIFTGNRHDVGYAKTRKNIHMIDFIQTVAGQRILASMDRFTKELPEKLDKIAIKMDRIANSLERLEHDVAESESLPRLDLAVEEDVAQIQKMVDEAAAVVTADGKVVKNRYGAVDGEDFTEEKVVEMPEQEEEHIPVVFGAETEDDSGVPLETGSMNKQHVPTETKEEEEEEEQL